MDALLLRKATQTPLRIDNTVYHITFKKGVARRWISLLKFCYRHSGE